MNTSQPTQSVSACARMLAQFVRINTCQPEGNERSLADAILRLLPAGTQTRIFEHAPQRSSLVVTVPGRSHEGALAFLGHLDTVAAGDPAAWIHPPHDAHITDDGILYGRGAADMKGGVTAMTLAALDLIRSGKTPRSDVFFCYTADEEKDGCGIQAIVASGLLDQVREVIVCEPSQSRPGVCEKGALWLRVLAEGVSCHASRPQLGVNAIEGLTAFSQALRAAVDTQTVHPLLGESSVSATRISGGIMTNIIPDAAEVTFDIRMIPGLSGETVLQAAHAAAEQVCAARPGLGLKLEVLNSRPAVETRAGCPLLTRIQALLRRAGADDTPKGIYFYTDMSQVVPRVPADFLIFGPGDDRQAHQINEHISVRDVERVAQIYTSYLHQWYLEEST